jgi:hypothetical protein
MKDIMVKVMAEVLSVLAIATKELEQGKASESIAGDGGHRYLTDLKKRF